MLFDHISIGGGVVGFNTTQRIIDNLISKKINFKRNFNFAIIDKNINNIIGGIAYNPELSSYGYFNNPIRLSPGEFIKFVKKNKHFKKDLLLHFQQNGGLIDKLWQKKYLKKLLNNNSYNFNEIYLPRASYGIWQKHRLIKLQSKINKFNNINYKNSNIRLFFFEAEVNKLEFLNNNIINLNSNNFFHFFEIFLDINSKNILIKNNNYFIKDLFSQNCSISLGLNPPKKFCTKETLTNSNYIWDFYSEGSTRNLIKIIKLNKNKKKIKIFFVGLKAGLLESLPELHQLIIRNKINVDINCISPSLESLQKAQLNTHKKPYKFNFLTKKNINNINKASEIINLISKEFDICSYHNYNKYDVWTIILKRNILSTLVNKLNNIEKKKYNTIYFPQLRSMTRFTYSYPLEIKDQMSKNGTLKIIRDKVKNIKYINNNLLINTSKNKYKADIVVNVSGPLSVKDMKNENSLINNLKKNNIKYDNLGFKVNENFAALNKKNIFFPGPLASSFNPNRITILKAILNNSNIASETIMNNILDKNNKYINYNFYFHKLKNLKKKNITKGGVTGSKEFFIKLDEYYKNNSIKKFFYYNSLNVKIIIDGKAGAGKSTIGKILSELFDIVLIDTGYILKALSSKLYKRGVRKNNLRLININSCLIILNNLNLKDIFSDSLNDLNLIPITSYLANNKLIRKTFNKKIKIFSKLLNSYIFTGRDTGVKVFGKEMEVYKFYLNVSDHIAALRKSKQEKSRTIYDNTIIRNIQDKKNIMISKETIDLKNDSNKCFSTVKKILNYIIK